MHLYSCNSFAPTPVSLATQHAEHTRIIRSVSLERNLGVMYREG